MVVITRRSTAVICALVDEIPEFLSLAISPMSCTSGSEIKREKNKWCFITIHKCSFDIYSVKGLN